MRGITLDALIAVELQRPFVLNDQQLQAKAESIQLSIGLVLLGSAMCCRTR
jgi:hypothetical protein